MAFRVAILFVLVCGGCSPLLQAQNLPDWLLPSENGRDFYIQGKVHLKSDSSVTDGEVEIIRYAADTLKHKFRTEDGFYEFFLHPDFTYKVIFRHTFTDAKPIIVDTHGPEEKAWKRGFALLLDIYLERVPDGFSRQLLAEPYGRIIYNPRERLFEPDAAYSSQQMSRWVDELERVSH
ncbi:MAG: hypothetical protein ACK58T_10000 [Phycisphaerae bacterium]